MFEQLLVYVHSHGDYINGLFEFFGAYFVWMNFFTLKRDRNVSGVYIPTMVFFTAWGLWNLLYYPSLGQHFSFWCGILLAAGNVAWVGLYMKIKYWR